MSIICSYYRRRVPSGQGKRRRRDHGPCAITPPDRRACPRPGRRAAAPAARYNAGMAWLYLLLAGLLEVGWAVGLKYSDGFRRLWPSLGTAAAMVASLALLAQALKTLPLGTAYTVWTGIGAVGTVLLGILLFGESRDLLRLLCIALIVAGVVGLRLVGGGH